MKEGEKIIFQEGQKQEERKPISRIEFLNELENQIETLRNLSLRTELKILNLERTKQRLFEAERMGMRVEFYEQGGQLFFEAKPKEPIGFVLPNKK